MSFSNVIYIYFCDLRSACSNFSEKIVLSQMKCTLLMLITVVKCFLVRSIFLKIKVEPLTTVLEQMVSGLDRFNLVRHIRQEPDVFKLLFCNSELLVWTCELFLSTLHVKWSEQGSNKKSSELNVYKAFIEMCDIFYHDGMYYCYLN